MRPDDARPDATDPADASGVPDVAGAVVGWRAWRLGRSGALEPQLIAAVERTVWPAGQATVATCRAQRPHDAPAPDCGCGLYAVADPGRMMGVAPDRGIIGCAALWGEVVEGTHGWRASHGYPQLLVAAPGLGRRALARLAERYGVPVHDSDVPLPELVGLFHTVLRDDAAALRTGVVSWSEVAARVRRHRAGPALVGR